MSEQSEQPTPGTTPGEPVGTNPTERRGPSRRGLLGLAGVGVAGAAIGGLIGRTTAGGSATAVDESYPFYGEHQAGISTAVQDHLHMAAFDLEDDVTRDELIELLTDWSYAASRITMGLDVSASGAFGGAANAPPDDTGEAAGLSASELTITFGFGPGLFVKDGVDRFGLADRRPDQLAVLPAFLGDSLRQEFSHGDLCIQACSSDPQVAVHAVRNLSRIAFGKANIRWSQLGFGRTSRTTSDQETPRNLFGFKDGTANILADDTAALDEHVWVAQSDGPEWMAGGTYLVTRKISMLIETWDRVRLEEQESIIGRTKREGTPMSGGNEFTEPDFDMMAGTEPAIPTTSHVRLAHPDVNNGIQLLRRGYNYVDGNNELGRLDAGLFFIAYQRSLDRFVTVQRSLSTDALNEYIKHIGSATFAIPPGAAEGSWVGAGLFE